MSDDDFNPDEGRADKNKSDDPTASPNSTPTPVPTPDPTNESGNRKKPRLFIRVWRIHRKRQKRTTPPNVAEKITVFLILVTAGIGAVQAGIYYQQKKIMESSGRQTDQLIEAAQIQASASRRIVEASRRESLAADRNTETAEAFATSAEGINKQTEATVAKLQQLVTSSRQAVTTAANNFVIDQRPYVWPAKVEELPRRVGQPIQVSVWFVDYGKTPALREKNTSKTLVYFGEGTLAQADKFFSTLDRDHIVGGSEVIIPPGIPPDAKQSQAFSTAYSDVILQDQAVIDGIDKTDGSFAVVGTISYWDAAGNHYWSDYCMMHLANGLMAWCARHNEIH